MNRFIAAITLSWACALPGIASAKLNVFACVPEWAALAQELGGNKVSVYQATSPRQDPHRVQARPSLVAQMRSADLMVCTGADLEVGWLPVLLQSAGNRKVQPGGPGFFLAADFVKRLEVPTRVDRAEGDVHPYGNPHVHLNPHNIAIIARELTKRLAALDPGSAAFYETRGSDFQTRWSTAIARWEQEAASLEGLRIVTYHQDQVYLIDWLRLVAVAGIEPKPGIPPSAGHLSALLERLQSEKADVITRMAYNEPKAPQWLSERTQIPVAELPFTVGGSEGAKDLFGLFDDTIARLKRAARR